MQLVPAFVVDLLPDDWWRPGNFRRILGVNVHLCVADRAKSIEVNQRVVAHGRKPFRYGKWD